MHYFKITVQFIWGYKYSYGLKQFMGDITIEFDNNQRRQSSLRC